MRRSINVIWQNKLLVAVVVSVLVVYAMGLIPDSWIDKEWDDRLRFGGGLLQLFGIVTVVVGMSEKRTLFNLSSVWGDQVKFWRAIKNYFHLGAAETTVGVTGVMATTEVGDTLISHATTMAEPTGKERGVRVHVDKKRGKGSQQTLYFGERKTIIRNPKDELKTGTYHAMLKQLGISEKDFK